MATVSNLSVLILAVAVIFCLLHFRKLSLPFRVLFYQLCFALGTEIVSGMLWAENINNLPLLHAYTLGEFCLLARMYLIVFDRHPLKRILRIAAAMVALCIAAGSLAFGSLREPNDLGRTLESVAFIALSVYYLAQPTTEQDPGITPSHHPFFWINAGILIYFSGSLFIFLFSGYLLSFSSDINMKLWSLHALLSLLLYCLILIGLWKHRSQKASFSG